jgi:hypothetical protein
MSQDHKDDRYHRKQKADAQRGHDPEVLERHTWPINHAARMLTIAARLSLDFRRLGEIKRRPGIV